MGDRVVTKLRFEPVVSSRDAGEGTLGEFVLGRLAKVSPAKTPRLCQTSTRPRRTPNANPSNLGTQGRFTMHILEFFDRIQFNEASRGKEPSSNDVASGYFMATETFDRYFKSLLMPHLSGLKRPNFVVCSLHHFLVHQLTMKLDEERQPQRFVQFGTLGGHEIFAANLRNYVTPLDLFCEPDRAEEYPRLAKARPIDSKVEPRFVAQTLADYVEEYRGAKSIGGLSIVNCTDLEATYNLVRACLPIMDHRADILIQGDVPTVSSVASCLNERIPTLHGSLSAHYTQEEDEIEAQAILVMQKQRIAYHKLSERLQDYGEAWNDTALFYS